MSLSMVIVYIYTWFNIFGGADNIHCLSPTEEVSFFFFFFSFFFFFFFFFFLFPFSFLKYLDNNIHPPQVYSRINAVGARACVAQGAIATYSFLSAVTWFFTLVLNIHLVWFFLNFFFFDKIIFSFSIIF